MAKSKLTPTEFIYKEFPLVKGRIDADMLNNFSGNELITLIEKYLKESSEGNNTEQCDQSALSLSIVSGSYSIDFGKHCKAKLQIENGEPKVEAAMDGWGEGISLSDITIEKL